MIRHARQRDENESAADVIRRTIVKHETPLPADAEQAWAAGVQKVDARTMALLRAAFEVGVEAGRQGKYSPGYCKGVEIKTMWGNPDENHISTSFVERRS